MKSKLLCRPFALALEDINGSPSFLEKALRFIESKGAAGLATTELHARGAVKPLPPAGRVHRCAQIHPGTKAPLAAGLMREPSFLRCRPQLERFGMTVACMSYTCKKWALQSYNGCGCCMAPLRL